MDSDELTDLDPDEVSDLDSDQESDQNSNYDWKAFAVVRAYVNDKERYDCIPSSWILYGGSGGYQTAVTYLFPSYEKLGKGIKFRKNLKPKKDWPDYLGKMLLDTDSQKEAFEFIKNEKARIRKIAREMGDSTSDSDSDGESPPKRSGIKRKQSEQENNKEIEAKSKKDAEEIEKKNESEKVEVKTPLHSHCYNFYAEFNASYQKSMSILDDTVDFLQKIITIHKDKAVAEPRVLSSSPKNHQRNDETPHDTTWTLRHPKPGQETIELMPNTGVYVSEKGLSECKIKYITLTEFTKGVLEQVFTEDAIRKCSYTGQPPKRQESEKLPTRPGLDVVARETVVSYIEQYGSQKGWFPEKDAVKIIATCIRNKLSDAYQKSKKTPKSRRRSR